MTRIYITSSSTIESIELIDGETGDDMLGGIIAGCARGDEWLSADMPDGCDWAMSQRDFDWWKRWARRERLVLDAYAAADKATRDMDAGLVDAWGHDMEALQDMECELYGIEA